VKLSIAAGKWPLDKRFHAQTARAVRNARLLQPDGGAIHGANHAVKTLGGLERTLPTLSLFNKIRSEHVARGTRRNVRNLCSRRRRASDVPGVCRLVSAGD
jgi:hypothetical protein